MTKLELLELSSAIAAKLQAKYSAAQINRYLRRYGIEGANQRTVPSKRVYVEELLSEASDGVVVEIARELGISSPAGNQMNSGPTQGLQTESSPPYAFISYQSDDRRLAARVKQLLARIDVPSFLAHEDIEVSDEWRARLLEELGNVTMFIAVLTSRYFESIWCVQESGIATFRPDLIVVPLSFDGTTPQGFLSHYQAKKVDERLLSLRDLLPSFLRRNRVQGLDVAVKIVGQSTNYRDAEANFEALRPHVGSLDDKQMQALLGAAAENEQVLHAARCVKEYLPPLIRSHGHLLDDKVLRKLRVTCETYGVTI